MTTREKETLTIDGVRFELYHWTPAHTSGDLIVYLPDQKVVAMGDVVVANRADDNPNIHPEKNGSSEGWLTTVKGILSLDADTYVPGHGDLLTKADVQRKLNATSERRAKIASMVKEGKSVADIKAALPDAPAPGAAARGAAPGGAPGGGGRGPAPGATPPMTYVDVVVAEVTKGR